MSFDSRILGFWLIVGVITWIPSVACALEPSEIVLITNRRVPASAELADHYAKVRQVPAVNRLALDLPITEDISRADYDRQLAKPLRTFLADHPNIACALCFYGVPLRVSGTEPTAEEKAQVTSLTKQRDLIRHQIKDARAADPKADIQERQREERSLDAQINRLSHRETLASVDSELMLVKWGDYPLHRWVVNPLYWRLPEDARKQAKPVMLTCRLDGPTPAIVRRCIDQAIAVEQAGGLVGKVYVDARGFRYNPKTDPGSGYDAYDESMREMAMLLKTHGKMDVILDDRKELFAVGACPDCALYCGWYSHANFIDSCQFVPGAIAWHLASSEAVSLRRADAKYWCKNLLERGAIATLGPVAEPYTIGFPKPAEFFGFVATGQYTLVECYARTVMMASWMGTLVGDPLYNPFAENAQLPESSVKPSPIGGQLLFPRMAR